MLYSVINEISNFCIINVVYIYVHTRAHTHTHTYIYIYKLATLDEGDPKAPFSIDTTPKCKGGRNSFPWIAPLYP